MRCVGWGLWDEMGMGWMGSTGWDGDGMDGIYGVGQMGWDGWDLQDRMGMGWMG